MNLDDKKSGFAKRWQEFENKHVAFMQRYMMVRNKICERVMAASNIRKIFGLRYHQLHAWEQKQVRIGGRTGTGDHAWRSFSIEDAISFAILLTLRRLGIPLGKNVWLVEWIRSFNLIDSVLSEFSLGKQVAIYFSLNQKGMIYIEGNAINERDILSDIRNCENPIVIVPLSGLMRQIMQKCARSDFHIEYDEKTKYITYFIDNKKVFIGELLRPKFKGGQNEKSI